LKETGVDLHKLTRFNSKKLLVVFTLLAVTVVIGLEHSQSIAETPHVYHKEIQIIPDPGNPKLFTFVGHACVDSKGEVLNPRVMLYSDLEQKPLWLVQALESDECFGAVQKILADDPDSIEAKLISYGDYSVIKEIEQKIEELKVLQAQQQKELKKLSDEKFPKDFNAHIDAMREVSDKLWHTQKLLQKETANYYEILRYLHPSDQP